jgi:hypothetical protein
MNIFEIVFNSVMNDVVDYCQHHLDREIRIGDIESFLKLNFCPDVLELVYLGNFRKFYIILNRRMEALRGK